MDNEKLEIAIQQLKNHYSNVDNILYDHHSKESLIKELIEIEDSIRYLESLVQ
jgi:hypothetical protein